MEKMLSDIAARNCCIKSEFLQYCIVQYNESILTLFEKTVCSQWCTYHAEHTH